MVRPRHWLLALVACLIVAGVVIVIWGYRRGVRPEELEFWVDWLGLWAPVGFIGLYAVATVAAVPGSIFDLAGGALFGPYLGTAFDLAGGTIGAALAFLVARYLARDWVEARAGPRLQNVMRHVDAEDWRFVAFMRLVPIFPYNIVNYLLGLTRIPFHRYLLATIVFMAPSTVAYTWLGYAGREVMEGDVHQIRYALIALALLGALIFLPRFILRIKRSS